MVLVSHKYKFIYIKNKKVAGSSVESFFGKYCNNPNKPYYYTDAISESIDEYGIIGSRTSGKTFFDIWTNHMPAKKIKNLLGNRIFNNYIKFCVIRNPYDKMVSRYYWNNSKENFKDFCKKTNVSNLNIHSIDKKSVCNYFIRYENLENDIIKLCKLLNINDYNIKLLPHHKSGYRNNNKHYREYYDNETKQIVYQNHKEEFNLFGYTF